MQAPMRAALQRPVSDDLRTAATTNMGGGPESGMDQHNPDLQMRSSLFAACKRPASLSDIRSFQNLHNPRIHSMTEWILQYDNARQRQNLYLDQIKELRQRFSKYATDNCPIKNNNGSGGGHDTSARKKPKRFWSLAWDPLLGSNVQKKKGKRNLGYQATRETCVLFTKHRPQGNSKNRLTRPDFWNGNYSVEAPPSNLTSVRGSKNQGVSNFKHKDNARCINIVNKHNNNTPSTAGGSVRAESVGSAVSYVENSRRVKLPPIGSTAGQSLDRHQTDYEPLERISRRNKLNLTSFLRDERARASSQASIDLSEVRVDATPIPRSP